VKEKIMTEKETENAYPVKTLHEFLSELNREWSRFKRGSLISIFISTMLLIAFVSVFTRLLGSGFVEITDVIFAILLMAFLLYSIRLMIVQYRFFRKWEYRMTRLFNLEEKLMPENVEETTKVPAS
jgi:hypothetical protein